MVTQLTRRSFLQTARVATFALLPLFGLGCGSGGRSIKLDGNITFQGNPVPHGFVAFNPVNTKTSGATRVTCSIRDGQYSFNGGGRVRCGEEYELEVGGYPRASTSEDDRVEPLFPLWSTKVVIPDSQSTFDIEVTP